MIEFRWTGDTPPDEERRSCKDCRHLQGAVSLWCTNDKAIESRGTSIPGVRDCEHWEAMLPVEKKGFFKSLFDFEQKMIVDLTVEGVPEMTQNSYPRRLRGQLKFITHEAPNHFERVECLSDDDTTLVLQASTTVGDYEDSVERPGSSFIHLQTLSCDEDASEWAIPNGPRINRDAARELAERLILWAETGSFQEQPNDSD